MEGEGKRVKREGRRTNEWGEQEQESEDERRAKENSTGFFVFAFFLSPAIFREG